MPDHDNRSFFTTDQNAVFPRPVLLGNGELVTCVGPTGYHTGEPIPPMQIFCMAGRRLDEPHGPLVRYGQLKRRLIVEGNDSESQSFLQELVPTEGILLSTNFHESLEEHTISFVCLDNNSAAFKTTVRNTSDKRITGSFELRYAFGDWEERVPARSHFEIKPLNKGMCLRFTVENTHLGATDLLCEQDVEFTSDERSYTAIWHFDLAPGESDSVAFLLGLGDIRRFRHTTTSWTFDDVLARQREMWKEYHSRCSVHIGNEKMEALRDICLYDIRCNSTPWSIPPCVTPTQWEGRSFHDEFFSFMGLVSAGYADLARKIPYYRLHTLDKAVRRSNYRGARYGWESFENGGEGCSYGHYIDEHFHMSQFGETAWQLYLYDGRSDLLTEFYPMLREIAEYYLLNMVEAHGDQLRIKLCTDFDETVYPVVNGIYTACAAIRSMEIAAVVGERVGESADKLSTWRDAAEGLRASLPRSEEENRYLTADGALHRHIAEVGPIFPFRVDHESSMVANTLDTFCEAVRTPSGLQPGDTADYGDRSWLWTAAHVTTAYSLLDQPDRAFEVLTEAPAATGPGLTPAEQVAQDGRVNAPWFTTGAGAYLYAMHSLFVQVLDDGTTKLPGLPSALADSSFERIAGAGGLLFSATFAEGKASMLRIESPDDRTIELFLSEEQFPGIGGWDKVSARSEEGAFHRLTLRLKAGENVWTP